MIKCLLALRPSGTIWVFLFVLSRYFPGGIDIYFENVGGPMLDAVLLNMAIHGRIAVCGMVSQHGMSSWQGIHNLQTLIAKRVRMQGFLQSDYLHLFPRFLEDVAAYYMQGKIVYIENMNEGLESAPAAFVALFSGGNVGKQVVCVATEWKLDTLFCNAFNYPMNNIYNQVQCPKNDLDARMPNLLAEAG